MAAKKSRRRKQTSPATEMKMLPIGNIRAKRLAMTYHVDHKEVLDKQVEDLSKILPPFVDWRWKQVCGQVVKRDPATGELHPVPFATVHVYDTDCSFYLYAPSGWPWVWLYPFNCHQEEIATVQTDACGNFCVWIPRWEIDTILRWRRERFCVPWLVRPTIKDLLPNFEQPIPRRPPFPPTPRPLPDPLPILEEAKASLERLGATEAIQRLEKVAANMGAGAPTHLYQQTLNAPLFPEPLAPPMPAAIPEEAYRYMKKGGTVSLTHAENADRPDDLLALRTNFIGPFMRCYDIFLPEWTKIVDVPDITFKVTQDVDNDGDEEVIYSETLFDVRWDSSDLDDPVTLEANTMAIAADICDAPEIECTDIGILMVGLMSLHTDYHDPNTGYAKRPNRPHPTGTWASLPPGATEIATAPYQGTLQLYGCNHHKGADFYRLLYSIDNGATWVPFTGHTWKVWRWSGGLVHLTVAPDTAGWYDILSDTDGWMPAHLLLNWPTTAYANGRYLVKMEFGNASKNVIHTTQPIAFRIDNSKPAVSVQVEYKRASDTSWHSLPTICPVIYRTGMEQVDFRVTFTTTAQHLLKARIGAGGCGAGGITLTSPTPAGWEVESNTVLRHWHQHSADNAFSFTLEYQLAAGSAAGTYQFFSTAWERSFNPAGGDSGLANDWLYDTSHIWTHVPIHFSVF